jgi:Tol biopolymer transport system component
MRRDRGIGARLSRAVDPIRLDVERRLGSVASGARRREARRRIGTLTLALGVGVGGLVLGWEILPRGSSPGPAVDETPSPDPSPRPVDPTGLIAYTVASADDDRADIRVASADGSGATELQAGPASEFSPVWSPDGTRVAFLAEDEDDFSRDIYVIDAGGSGRRKVVDGQSVTSVSWSPDGEALAFTDHDVYVVGPDGSGDRRVLRGYWENVAWSPDGSRLLLAGFPRGSANSGTFDLWTVRPDGTDLVQLTNDETTDTFPSWSPDGSRITFQRNEDLEEPDYRNDVYVMNADGSGLRRVTVWPGFDGMPVWSPDGRFLAFSSDRLSNPTAEPFGPYPTELSLYVTRADGSGGTRMIVECGPDENVYATSWKPAES